MGVYTNTMRYTGTSGVDVESMVQALMKAEGTKADRLYREKQKLEWTQQMFRDMGTSVKTFNNNYLSFSSTSSIVNMRSTAAYSNKSVSGKFSGGDTISTGSSKNTLNLGGNSTIGTTSATAPGDYEIDVKSVATGDSYQGKTMGGEVVSTTSVENIVNKIAKDQAGQLKEGDYLGITINGRTENITLKDTDIQRIADAANTDKGGDITKGSDELVKVLQEKINTTFGTVTLSGETEKQNKVTVSINDDGNLQFTPNQNVGTTFSINPPKSLQGSDPFVIKDLFVGGMDGDGEKFFESFTEEYTFRYGKDYTANISVKINAGDTKEDYVKNFNESITNDPLLKGNITAYLDTDGNVAVKKSGNIPDIEMDSIKRSYDAGYAPEYIDGGNSKGQYQITSNNAIYTVFDFKPTTNTSTFNVNQKTGFNGRQELKIGGKDYSFDITEDMTYKDVMNKVNATGKASLTFNTNTNGFTLQSKVLGENGTIEIPDKSFMGTQMQLGATAGGTHKGATNAEVHVKGPNGIDQTLIRETNTFSYADINFKLDPNLQSKIDAAGEGGLKIEMSVTTDTGQAYDNIKGFIDAYNTLIEQLSAATNTPRSKAGDYSYYEPLTEAEKEGMSDAQIEKLENKAKQGMLYRNPELTRLQNKLREITTTEVTMADGSKMSLAKIGITTGDYSQGGKLFIDEDKLRGALESNSDNVAKLFTDSKNGIAEKIYKSINDAVGSEGYITKKVGFTDSIYSKDNYYSKQIEQKSKELDRLNDYLMSKENYYYSMFANMEKVITESNNQMASLMNY